MADYELHRLSTREFEHMAQALLVGVFGAGIEIFGDGSDNGREAFYSRPLSSLGWTGQTVFQAKFLQEPRTTTGDTSWFKREVTKEMAVWADPDSRRRRDLGLPDNILFLTNATLAPSGGYDAGKSDLEASCRKLGMSASAIWHYDSLGRLLDNQQDVRKAYAGLITPGDILEQLSEILLAKEVNIGSELMKHARQTLENDQIIRLSDSGDPKQSRLRLNQIAIDLPASSRRKGGPAPGGIVPLALALGDRCLKPSILRKTEPEYNPTPSHLMLIGGPGQGKTTISQLLTTAYRTEFCRTHDVGRDSDVLQDTLAHFDREKITTPRHRRWPIRIDLAKFGEHAAGGGETHLLRWVAEAISQRSIATVTAVDLHDWFKSWPCLLVLDGFDEVVAPQAREAVANSIQSLLDDIETGDLDLFIVITSRPQGYNGELTTWKFETLWLTELSVHESLRYARRLISLRLHDDLELRDEVFKRVQTAAATPVTAGLMKTPLQTTIMAILNELSVRAPRTRWELFNSYYDTIYNRETNKSGGLAELLNHHRPDVDAIHEAAARHIQYQLEQPSSGENALPSEEFSDIVIKRLHQEGYEGNQADMLAERITKAATERLVLLVPQGSVSIGFEVRSLQEYFVARSITAGPSEAIEQRLDTTRDAAYWHNTWLLAAGSIFARRPELRDSLIEIVKRPHPHPSVSAIVQSGQTLALELLHDGIAAPPKYRRSLADHALT